MCSTCRAKLVEGDARMEVNYSLEPWELKAGFILTCQARPVSDNGSRWITIMFSDDEIVIDAQRQRQRAPLPCGRAVRGMGVGLRPDDEIATAPGSHLAM